MEAIYSTKGFSQENVELRKYFKQYSIAISSIIVGQKTVSLKSILNKLLPKSENLTKSEFHKLKVMINGNQLKLPSKIKGNDVIMKFKGSLLEGFPNKHSTIASKKGNLKKQFLEYQTVMINGKNENCNDIDEVDMPEEEIVTTTGGKTKTFSVNDETEKASSHNNLIDSFDDEIYSNSYCENIDSCSHITLSGPSSKTSYTYGKAKSCKMKNSIVTRRGEVVLNARKRRKNIQEGKHFIVSFRIHNPFMYSEDSKEGGFMQEIIVLDDQTLQDLRDKIICQSDFLDCQGDVSEHPDDPPREMARYVYKSAMFYIDNTFYIDTRDPCNQDYSSNIKDWGRGRGIAFGDTKSMGSTKVGDLIVRFGYPYVYVHQGCCEHLVIVNDARLLTGRDSLHWADYPLLSQIPRHYNHYCYLCKKTAARWLVKDNDRLLYSITLMCHGCFKGFNYIDGTKVGQFKAYHYLPRTMLL